MPETNIATQITRITNDRNTIRNKVVDFGLAESTANLDALATAIDSIVNQGGCVRAGARGLHIHHPKRLP